MVTAYLCKCNNCNSILIDANPQIGAKEHNLTGTEIEMQYFGESGIADLDGKTDENFWGCPKCLTDGYLMDL